MDAGADTIREGKVHQYTRPAGHPPLVEVLAKRYSKHLGRDVDPLREVPRPGTLREYRCSDVLRSVLEGVLGSSLCTFGRYTKLGSS